VQSRFIYVDHRNVHYLEGGCVRKPTIVLLHGWSMSAGAYRRLGSQLAENYHVLIPDLPGFGRSEGMRRVDWEAYAYWLCKFLTSLELNSVTLVGHSMGGAIGLRLAQIYPRRVSLLILLDSTGIPTQRSVFGWTGVTVKKAFRNARYPRGSASVIGAFFRNLRHPVSLVRTYRATTSCDLTVHPAPSVPVHLVWGEKDEFYPDCTPLAQCLGIKPIILRTNHDWPITRPHLANDLLRSFMTSKTEEVVN
jgi:pimeloyl-ACP methyl ester carboxylesterase